jgi:DNA-binding transcriptional MerR regulator
MTGSWLPKNSAGNWWHNKDHRLLTKRMAGINLHKEIKTPTKLYRIGEVVRCTPFTRQTIHNYTTMGLLPESEWTEGGHRLYDESVFRRLAQILELRKTKTMAEIRRLLLNEPIESPNPSGHQFPSWSRNKMMTHETSMTMIDHAMEWQQGTTDWKHNLEGSGREYRQG